MVLQKRFVKVGEKSPIKSRNRNNYQSIIT